MATSLNPRDQIYNPDAGAAAATSSVIPFSQIAARTQSKRLQQCVIDFSRWLHFPNDHEIVKVILGTVAANYMQGRPVWLMIIGPSSCGKTELIETLFGLPNMHHASDFTKAGLLSGRLNKEGHLEVTGGLLHDIGEFGFMLFPEFSSILTMDHRAQGPVLSLLRQVYDGKVVREIGGEDGGKLSWTGKAPVIAASAPGIDSRRHVIQEMGERFIYKRLEFTREDRDLIGRLQGRNRTKWQQGRSELKEAVRALLKPVISNPPTIELADAEATRLRLLVDFSAQCRSAVERNTSWERQAEETHQQEIGGGRMFNALAELFVGMLAIGCGYADTWAAMTSVMWDSIPYLRTQVLRTIATMTEPGGHEYVRSLRKLTDAVSAGLSDRRQIPERAVARAAEELAMQGILEQLRSSRKGTATGWRLSEDTWMRYALIVGDVPQDPRRGLLGSATVI